MLHGEPQSWAVAEAHRSVSSPAFQARDLAMVAQGAREGDGDPYPSWHEAAEGLERPGVSEGRRRRSELDEKVLEAWR
jgi:hypothetical protein